MEQDGESRPRFRLPDRDLRGGASRALRFYRAGLLRRYRFCGNGLLAVVCGRNYLGLRNGREPV